VAGIAKKREYRVNITKWERGLALLVFVLSIVGIVILSFRYVRNRPLTVYGLTGGSGQLWLTVLALSSLEVFLIATFDVPKRNKTTEDQGVP